MQNDREPTVTEQDAVDVELAVSGDAAAFERLYRRHLNRVHGLARWLLGHDDVDDVLQDVFVRAWEKLHTFKGQSAFATWLHRLATNVILRRRQERRTHDARHAGAITDLDRAYAERTTPGLGIDLEAAVGALPGKAREVFVLHDVVGYKHEEIAEQLGISAGTSRSQLHHARMALRQYFEA
ncbi:MAG: RNA polymerase sigma factor [Gemmatimonadales bacterium]|nr:RNA polymerase sigma factor [Gemmatimonadales bacterium]